MRWRSRSCGDLRISARSTEKSITFSIASNVVNLKIFNRLIITADHDHYLTLNDDFPDRLRRQGAKGLTDVDTAVDAGHYWGSQPVVAKDNNGKELPETGKYGWGNHSNRPVPIYYQGFASDLLTKSIGQGFKLYDTNIPGIPGLTDEVHIYRTQFAAVTGVGVGSKKSLDRAQ